MCVDSHEGKTVNLLLAIVGGAAIVSKISEQKQILRVNIGTVGAKVFLFLPIIFNKIPKPVFLESIFFTLLEMLYDAAHLGHVQDRWKKNNGTTSRQSPASHTVAEQIWHGCQPGNVYISHVAGVCTGLGTCLVTVFIHSYTT